MAPQHPQRPKRLGSDGHQTLFFSFFSSANVEVASQNLQAPDVGWWPYNVYVAGSFYATTPDEVEFMAAQAAAWGGAQNLETDLGWLSANGRTADALQRSSNWHSIDLPESVKERIRSSHMVDYQIFSNVSGSFIRELFHHPPVICDAASCAWHLAPHFAQSSVVGVRARALTALAEDGSGQTLMMYGEGTHTTSYLGLPRSTLNTSITFPTSPKGTPYWGGTVLELNYNSAVGTAEAMGLFTEVFVSALDLSGHTAIGLALRGDSSSNATVVVRLEDSEGECRNFFIDDLNFTGWRNLTLNAPQPRRLFDFPLIRQNTAMRYFRWSAIKSMTIAVTNALAANVAISSVVARAEEPAELTAATVQAGGKSFPLPEGLKAQPCSALACEWTGLGCFPTPDVASCAEYAECSESGCQAFDANNGKITRVLADRAHVVKGPQPQEHEHDEDIAVSYVGQSRARAEITVIEQSSDIMGPFTGLHVQQDTLTL